MTNSLQRLLVASAMVLLTGCGNFSLGDSRIEGTVLDDTTGKPVVDAIVIAQWKGNIHGIVQGSSVCYHVETALTDANGKFVIPAWHRSDLSPSDKAVTEKRRSIIVYMEGYNNLGRVPMMDSKGVIRIPRALQPGEQRLRDIGIGVDYGCGWEDDSAAQLDLLSERSCAETNAILKQLGRPAERCRTPYKQILESFK